MRDLLESKDTRGGNRDVVRDPSSVVSASQVAATVNENDQPARAVTKAPVLLLDHVSKWYGPVIGVNQVTLELRPGIMGLVGANGAGKSTLMGLAVGFLRPDLGAVRVRGLDPWTALGKREIGFCPDRDNFYEDMSGRQFVGAMARLRGYSADEARRRTEDALAQVGMTDRSDRKLRGYSKGMRQRIKLAQALVHDPELLILDEPLSGIDPIGRQEFLALFQDLANRGKALLISSHELEELEKLTDLVAVMSRGRIAAVGTLAQIRDLLDDHPLSIRIDSMDSRRLAGSLLALNDVVGVDFAGEERLLVRATNPRRFFREFSGLVLEEGFEIQHLETLDESAHAVLGYLLGGRRGVNN
jgi:ABC-2 type transport system ATP-binding protein